MDSLKRPGLACFLATAVAPLATVSAGCFQGSGTEVLPDAAIVPVEPVANLSDPQSDTTIMQTEQARPSQLVADNSHLYWLNLGIPDLFGNPAIGEIVRMPLGGGTIEVVATGLRQPHDLVLDEDNIYWIELGRDVGLSNGSIWTAVKDGSAEPAALVTGLEGITNLSVRGTRLYWTQGSPAQIVSSTTNGSDRSIVEQIQIQGSVKSLTLTDDYFYWGENARVARFPVDGDDTKTLAVLAEGAIGLQVGNNHLYWAAERGEMTVYKMDLSTETSLTIAREEGAGLSSGLAITDSAVFYAAGSSNDAYSIMRAPLEPAESTEVWQGSYVSGLIAGPDCIYWATLGEDETSTGTVHMVCL